MPVCKIESTNPIAREFSIEAIVIHGQIFIFPFSSTVSLSVKFLMNFKAIFSNLITPIIGRSFSN